MVKLHNVGSNENLILIFQFLISISQYKSENFVTVTSDLIFLRKPTRKRENKNSAEDL